MSPTNFISQRHLVGTDWTHTPPTQLTANQGIHVNDMRATSAETVARPVVGHLQGTRTKRDLVPHETLSSDRSSSD